jgi:hypothetical protein
VNIYHEADPWHEEPMGPEYAYMLRKSATDGWSVGGMVGKRFQWPKTGLVVCPNWEGDDDWRENAKSRLINLPPGFGLLDGGLWGYLHGAGMWMESDVMYPDGIYQLCKVKTTEARPGRGGSYRVPRAWVVFSGSQDFTDITSFLRKRGDEYSLSIARNFVNALEHRELVKSRININDVADILRPSQPVLNRSREAAQ